MSREDLINQRATTCRHGGHCEWVACDKCNHYEPDVLNQQPCDDCRNCKKWNECPCGKEGHENGTSIGCSIGECKNYEPCDDCISRAKAIEESDKLCLETAYDNEKVIEMLNDLPSVGKDINVTTNEDCISRQEVLDKLNRLIEVERLQGTDEMGYGRERVSAYERMIHSIESKYLYPSVNPQQLCEDAVSRDCDKCAYYDNGANNEACNGCFEDEEHLNFKPKAQHCDDCISRQAVLDGLASIAKVKARSDAQKSLMGRIMFFVEQLPPVTPKEKTGYCKDCKWWKDNDGVYRRGIGAESKCPINCKKVYEGNGYCFMFEPQESEVQK